MAFTLSPDQVIPAWKTLTLTVTYAPKTGSKRPWEVHACFTFPFARRVFWGSFKTQEAAEKRAARGRLDAVKVVAGELHAA